MTSKISNKFTQNYKDAITMALKIAGKNELSAAHILAAILAKKNIFAQKLFAKSSLLKQETQDNFILEIKAQKNLEKDGKRAIQISAIAAMNYKHTFIGLEHLLLGILETKNSLVKKFLLENKTDLNNLKKQLHLNLGAMSKFLETKTMVPAFTFSPKQEEYSDDFSGILIELTDKNIARKLKNAFYREKETTRLMETLIRREKNNPLLLGEPGVGKTAIVEDLSKKIYEERVPALLLGKKIYKLDLSLLVAGTMFRGDFETRINDIIEFISETDQNILFIDEIHNIVGAGSTSETLDASNILKPALSRGEIRLIGATTFADYKKSIEKNKALARRFATITIKEPSVEETYEILKFAKKDYENHHNFKISNRALQKTLELAEKYLPNKKFPDKALEILDETLSSSRLKNHKHNFDFIISKSQKKLEKARNNFKKAVGLEMWTQAREIKKMEQELLKIIADSEKLKKIDKELVLGEIKEKDISEALEKMTNIPISQKEKTVKNLESKILEKIIGQDEAVKKVVLSIQRSTLGLGDKNRPMASFLFLGPTGVGKTSLAKITAENFFSKDSFLKIDMSEFSEKFMISRLIGAPAGYVGYDEGGKLTEFVKHHPHSLILFDEIEKGHPSILNILLQILEDGILTDSAGEKIDFKNTVIVLTSNIGLEEYYNGKKIGFGKEKNVDFKKIKEKIMENLKNQIRPELLNRLNKIIVFNELTTKIIEKIIALEFDEISKRLLNLKITVDNAALAYFAKNAFSPQKGARGARKVVEEFSEQEIAKMLLSEKKYGIIKVGKGQIKIDKYAKKN